MVARISTGTNPTGAVYYNEEKVSQGEAKRLALRNYAGLMTPFEEVQRHDVAAILNQQCELNTRIVKPTFHVSLALAPGEKPDADELLCMADAYMIGMGYGQQPYAVYQHFDTDHTHIHIVSVRVDHEGKKISDRFEKERSNTIRKQLEKDFGLKEAEKVRQQKQMPELKPVAYGQGDLKRNITNVVLTALDFRFSSFAQFNQLLGIYNVKAVEVPLEGKAPGLKYTVVGEEGGQAGVGFKASSLRQQPTMETVERRIKSGKKAKQDAAPRLRKLIETRFESSKSWIDFQQKLRSVNILIVPHQGKDENLFGISFIDAKQKAIYSGSELGKGLSAGSLKDRLGGKFEALPIKIEKTINQSEKQSPEQQAQSPEQKPEPESHQNTALLRRLLQAAFGSQEGNESEQELKKMVQRGDARKSLKP